MPSAEVHLTANGSERVGLLLRVSSEEQRDRETVEIQREFLNQYAGLYGLEIAGVYADDGVSGTIPMHERPQGRRLLEDAKAGGFSTVLVSTAWTGSGGPCWSSWTPTTAYWPRAWPSEAPRNR